MNMKIVLAVLIFLLVLGLTFFVRLNQTGYNEDNLTEKPLNNTELGNNVSVKTNSSSGSGSSGQKVSAEVLGQHNTEQSCWVAYKGKVYDITSFLTRHPGGVNAISQYCGTSSEFENAFTRQHGTSKVSMLMRVGVLIGDFGVVGNLGN